MDKAPKGISQKRWDSLGEIERALVQLALERKAQNKDYVKRAEALGGDMLILDIFIPTVSKLIEEDGSPIGEKVEALGAVHMEGREDCQELLQKALTGWATQNITNLRILIEASEGAIEWAKDNMGELIFRDVTQMLRGGKDG